MRIAQLAPLVESCPPIGYGGTELVVSLLTEELMKKGHDVTLFASGDSRTSARLVPSCQTSLRTAHDIPNRRWSAYDLKAILNLLREADQFDVIHNHMGFNALPHLHNTKAAVVTTIHNPIADYCAEIFMSYPELPYVAISDTFRRLNYGEQLNYVATIHNGIDIDAYSLLKGTSQDYLLFIGRMCSDKGPKEAIEIAGRLGLPIVLAGKVDAEEKKYFETEIRPLLGPGVRYEGEVTFQRKCELYRDAIATVCPVKFDEPFGLVFAESLAAGTPVLALRRGAAVEVISDGETGILGDTVEELVNRFSELKGISGKVCRERARLLFSKERMANEYENLYTILRSPSLVSSRRSPSFWRRTKC